MTSADASPPSLFDYDAIAFDCDGVLLDSNDLKVEAFRRVTRDAGFASEVVEAFSAFQTQNFGTSRHRLFERLLGGQFGPAPADATLEALLDGFGRAVSTGYLEVDEAPGMRRLVETLAPAVPLFVVSGSDEAELLDVFAKRDLSSYFVGVYGSPATKTDNLARVRDVLAQRGIAQPRLLFVGDAEADANAAAEAGADFVFAARYSKVRERLAARAAREGFPAIDVLADLLPTNGPTP